MGCSGGRTDGTKVPFLSDKTLHMMDFAQWMLPFVTKTDVTKAALEANISHETGNRSLILMLDEHSKVGAREQLKKLWTQWVKNQLRRRATAIIMPTNPRCWISSHTARDSSDGGGGCTGCGGCGG